MIALCHWLVTGSLFAVDADGTDDMFACSGENILPKGVKDQRLTHPLVPEAGVVPPEYAAQGEALLAQLVASPNLRVDETGLKEFGIRHGPSFAHPRRIIFIDVLPLNDACKVERARVGKELSDILFAATSA